VKFLRILAVLVLCVSLEAKFKQGSIIVDARAEALVEKILKRLCNAVNRDSVPKIYFIVDNSINAFATDEGAIYIHTGLIMKLEDVDQLIAVLAHELGHILGGHIHRFRGESAGISAASIIGTLLGGAAALAGGGGDALVAGILLGQGAAQGEFAKFTRTHEKEADAAAFRMLQAAGLSTSGGIRVFEYFKKVMAFSEPPYLKTHPSDQERINAFKDYIKQSPDSGSTPESWVVEFENIKAIFIANLNKISDAERVYYAKNSQAATLAKAIILSRRGSHKEALAKLDVLVKDDPNNPYLQELYGQFLMESGVKNYEKAIEHLKKAVALEPKALSIRLLYAQALYNSDTDRNVELALAQLDRITQDDTRNAMAWLLKVGIYSKLKQHAQADLAQAEYANITGDKKLAASRAKRASKSGDEKVKKKAKLLEAELKGED
jgi:predicted Zn-dependent protease